MVMVKMLSLRTLSTCVTCCCFLVLVIGPMCQADDSHPNDKHDQHLQPKSNICGTKCTCADYGDDGYKQVDCSKVRLKTIPQTSELPPKTAKLDVSQNDISQLSQLEHNDDLQFLSLAMNNMSKLDNIAFENTRNLKSIDLSYNELTQIPEEIFYSLEDLNFLDLSHNQIEALPQNLFKKCGFLNKLNLGHNPLRFIDPNWFKNLHDLSELDLSHNEIWSLNTETFHSLSKLATLDLSENEFQAVPNNALQMIRDLRTLDLSKNSIKVLNEASFIKLSSLREIKMNKMNSLSKIDKKSFSPLYNLEKLSIADNPHLFYIDEHAFVGMFNHSWIKIREVSFRRNRLSKLSEKTLPFCNLTSLDLQENAWICDCHLHWIKYCHGKPEFARGIICAKPEQLRNHEVEMVPHSSMTCPRSGFHHSSMLLAMSLLFMLMMFATLIVFIYRDKIANYYSDKRKQGPIYYVRAGTDNVNSI